MKDIIVTLETTKTFSIDRKYAEQTFGEIRLMVDYFFNITDGSVKNSYIVTCEVSGIETGCLRLRPARAKVAEFQGSTNEFTLNETAVITAFEEEIEQWLKTST
jgi:hypothetical protein